MPKLESVDSSLLYMMFKGEPGTRKSTQALSFLPLGNQYWFSWDKKMQGILVPARKWGYDLSQVEYDDYDDWNKARTKLEQFQVNCSFKTLVFDSITSCADMILRQTLSMKKGITRQSGAQAGKTIAGIPVNELEDYNAESSALNELIALTKDIHTYHKVNIILIAHVMEVTKMENNKTSMSRTIVTAGKRVAAKIPAYCGEVYHFDIKTGLREDVGGEYRLLTEHTGNDFARSALDLPVEIIFNDKPLYENWIKPAIEKLRVNPVAVNSFK